MEKLWAWGSHHIVSSVLTTWGLFAKLALKKIWSPKSKIDNGITRMSSSIFYRTENIRRHSNLEQHSARCRTMKMKNMPAISHPNRKLPQETCCMTSAAASLQYKIKTLQQAAGRRQNHPLPPEQNLALTVSRSSSNCQVANAAKMPLMVII